MSEILNKTDIANLLPHRDPMLLIDQLSRDKAQHLHDVTFGLCYIS